MSRMGEQVDELDELLPAHCPSPYLDTWDRHHSIAFSNTKGLRNAPGENNCFVNCAVQVFWHLDVFRRSYRRLSGHTCMGNSCIFCALKVIFTQFQYSDKSSLHPDALRKALAETFANQQRFQLGHMDDAAECFENILRRLHFHVANNFNEDTCSAAHCLPHQKFSMAVQEKVVCVCGASTSPLKFTEMVHYVSASALIAQSRQKQGREEITHPDHFGMLLRKASAMGDVRNCPANCGKQVQKQRTLMNIPDVVSVGLVWDSDRPSVQTTTEVARVLGTTILLPDMYHHVMPDPSKLPHLQLVAVVCYYGKHYSTFVFHSKLKTWIYFDDATVREIGPLWSNVVDKCSRGRFQPLLLLYANDNATPISVDTAPQKRVMAPGYTPAGTAEEGNSGLDRTHESIKSLPSSSRRSTTPTPKPSQQSVSRVQPHISPQDTGRESPARLTRDHIRQPSFLSAVSKERSKQGESGEGVGILPGGAAYKSSSRRQLLDGGANSGRLETMLEDGGDYPDYTLSSGDQYRRPSSVSVDTRKPLPVPPNTGRNIDDQRKVTCKKDRGGVDVVRYQVDPARGTPDFTMHQPAGQGICGKGHVRPSAHPGPERCVTEKGVGVSAGGQHVVVKPTPTAHAHHDTADTSSHTPVQSGLATLPRKGHNHYSEPSGHHQSGSTHREMAHPTHRNLRSCSPLDRCLPPGTPPPEYDSVLGDPHLSHSRQASTSSQASSMRSSVSMGNLHQLASGKLSDPEQVRNIRKDAENQRSEKAMKKSESESEVLGHTSKQYIDRRMVETILKHQGVHRHGSSCSNSSVDSDSVMGRLIANRSATTKLRVDIPADTVSLGSQKDSGCGSSDRHSSSSTGSGSIDPFPQCFFNKSMIVPRSFNTNHAPDQQYVQLTKGPSDSHGSASSTSQMGSNHGNGPKVMHPIKESSQEDVLKSSPNEPIGTQKFILANPSASEARPPPVPPKNFAQFQIIKSSHSLSSAPHERESSLESLVKDESINRNFVSLCKKADALMDKCTVAETGQDMTSALYCSEEALGCLKEAMTHKELNSKARAYLQKKHNSCLLKVRTLQKRAPASRQESHSSGIGSDVTSSVGNRSSITSSDSDLSDQIHRHSRQAGRPGPSPAHRPLPPHPTTSNTTTTTTMLDKARDTCGQGTVAVRQGQTMDCKTSYHGGMAGQSAYCDSEQSRTSQTQPSGRNHLRTDSSSSRVSQSHYRTDSSGSNLSQIQHRTDNTGGSCVPQSHSANYVSLSSISGGDSSADLYGTLPRNKSRKPGSETTASAEMYRSFLNRQKSLQAEVTSSQQSLDSVRSDAGSDVSNKMNKSQIRQMLQDSIVQRQWHQSGAGQPNSTQQSSQQSGTVQHSNHPQRQESRQAGQPSPRPGMNAGIHGHSALQQQQTLHPRPTHLQPQQLNLSNHPSQHQQRQPPPAGYSHPQTAGQTFSMPTTSSQPVVSAPGPKASSSNPQSAGRPRTPSQTSTSSALSISTTSHNSGFPPRSNSEMGKRSTPQNVARVTPYSHLLDAPSSRGGGSSYLVMIPPSQPNHPSSAPRGSQAPHAAGTARPLTPASRPLETSTSQSDCHRFRDSAGPSDGSEPQ